MENTTIRMRHNKFVDGIISFPGKGEFQIDKDGFVELTPEAAADAVKLGWTPAPLDGSAPAPVAPVDKGAPGPDAAAIAEAQAALMAPLAEYMVKDLRVIGVALGCADLPPTKADIVAYLANKAATLGKTAEDIATLASA